MNGLLLDTHVWIWFVEGSRRLPPKLRRRIEASLDRGMFSPISLFEMTRLLEAGRIRVRTTLGEWFAAVRQGYPFVEAPLTAEVALRAAQIRLPARDPADHLIASTALVHGLTLATVDEGLLGQDWLPTTSG